MNLVKHKNGGISSNSYLVVSNGDAVLVDCSIPLSVLQKDLTEQCAVLRCIILTHGHFDHIGTLEEIRTYTGAEVIVHANDAEMLNDNMKNGYDDFFHGEFHVNPADRTVQDGDVIAVGDMSFKVIHTPGHSKGSVCLEIGQYLFTGDTLFANNIGRSDLYGGDDATIMKSLKMLAGMNPKLEVHPGHGPSSTIESEVRSNYYIRDALQM